MELTIDTASPLASVALTEHGRLRAELTWHAGRDHSAGLLPMIERLLAAAGANRAAIDAIFVNRGPGSYGGLRVGISTALALAAALDTGILGYGRLAADALPWLALGRPVVAAHDAGRGEYAWAVYTDREDGPVESLPPHVSRADAMLEATPPAAIVAGEIGDELAAELAATHPDVAVIRGHAAGRRAATGASLAWRRWTAGDRDSRLGLTPIYLKEPHITPARRPLGLPADG